MSLLTDRPDLAAGEVVRPLVSAPGVRIERIVSHGHASPDGFCYDQGEDEWVAVLAEAARLRFEDGTVEMRQGDHLLIPARKRHRVEWTTPDGPTVWLAVFHRP